MPPRLIYLAVASVPRSLGSGSTLDVLFLSLVCWLGGPRHHTKVSSSLDVQVEQKKVLELEREFSENMTPVILM